MGESRYLVRIDGFVSLIFAGVWELGGHLEPEKALDFVRFSKCQGREWTKVRHQHHFMEKTQPLKPQKPWSTNGLVVNCMTLGKSPKVSEPQLCLCENMVNNIYLANCCRDHMGEQKVPSTALSLCQVPSPLPEHDIYWPFLPTQQWKIWKRKI